MRTICHNLLICCMLVLCLTACRDEEFPSMEVSGIEQTGEGNTRTDLKNPGYLQQEGDYWVATGQVPLVGVGRVVDDISGSLVGLIDFTDDNNLDNLIDEDLGNCAKLKNETVGLELLANQGVAVKDMYRNYAGGQIAGFAIKQESASLLTLDVLKTFFIETYLDGKKQESIGATKDTEVLDLNLLSPKNSSVQLISCATTKPFDEVKLCFGGVSADVLAGLQIYYAFVGENKAVPILKSNFPGAEGSDAYPFHESELTNDKLTDGPGFGIIQIGSIDYTVSFGNTKKVPTGSEIGFATSSGGLLGLGLFKNTKLTYTYSDDTTEEVTLDGSLLGLSLIGGGNTLHGAIPQEDKKVIKVEIAFTAIVSLDLKWTTVHYAYYREPVQLDPTTYFVVANDTVGTASYALPKPDVGNVIYTFESGPAMAAVTNNTLTGMTEDGTYCLHAVYTAADGKQTAYNFVIVKKEETVPACHMPITQKQYPNAQVIRQMSLDNLGCLLCLEGESVDEQNHRAGNLVDVNTNNYAGGITGVNVAQNRGIVGVDAGQTIGTEGQEMRVGFVLQTTKEFLNLSALSFFRIRVLDDDGKQIEDAVPGENNTVGLGLLNGNSNKVRVSVKVSKPFQKVELYKAGVADVGLSALRVYYAFWEDISDNACSETSATGLMPDGACTTLLSNFANHTEIDYEHTKSMGVANVDATFASLGNAIDNNNNTAALIPITNVIGGTQLGIKFDQLGGNQQVGVILRDPNGVLSLTAIKTGISIKAYLDDAEVNLVSYKENMATGSPTIVDLSVIGYGDRYYLEVTPMSAFNRIVIDFGTGLADVLTFYEVYGVYYRPDADGDGIPDCSEDPDETPDEDDSGGVTMQLQTTDICVGDAISIQAQEGVGVPADGKYWLKCEASGIEPVVIPVGIENGQLVATDSTKPLLINTSGIYSLRLYSKEDCSGEMISSKALIITVHPDVTTWTGSVSNDWNTWNNWSDGTPWECTNVIIPGGCSRYPVLKESAYKDKLNRCNYIHIKDGGQLVNSFYLNQYAKAWVDIKLKGGRYYMLSAPLKDMISGDMFISPGLDLTNKDFIDWNEKVYPEVRIHPYIYQRLWNTNAPVKNPAGYQASGVVVPDETHWTPPYNALTQPYRLGEGFSLMAGTADTGEYTFVFPKIHTIYHYYNLAGTETGLTENVHQTTQSLSGRFIDEGEWENGILNVTLTNQQAGLAFLAGNPFMAHINLASFMSYNGINEVKVYDGNVNNTLILIDGELVSSTGSSLEYILPMEAFFVMDNSTASTRQITFTQNMLSTGTVRTRAATRASSVENSLLRISASAGGTVSKCLVRIDGKADAGVRPGEDTRLLVEGDTCPAAVVYTVADGTALDIQQVPASVNRIPLGFYLRQEGMDVTLAFEGADSKVWQDYCLVDSRTGKQTDIQAGHVTLHQVESGNGVYYLERK